MLFKRRLRLFLATNAPEKSSWTRLIEAKPRGVNAFHAPRGLCGSEIKAPLPALHNPWLLSGAEERAERRGERPFDRKKMD
jgi:hypothetical protein